jgi:hypothetical protein
MVILNGFWYSFPHCPSYLLSDLVSYRGYTCKHTSDISGPYPIKQCTSFDIQARVIYSTLHALVNKLPLRMLKHALLAGSIWRMNQYVRCKVLLELVEQVIPLPKP